MVERLTREKVVEQAADLSDEIGFHELTITKLGRALGIAPPGVYRHVAEVDDLRRAISRFASREAAAVLSSACAGRSGADALAALASSLREWAKSHPGRYTALQVAPDPDDDGGQAATEPVLEVISSVLRAYRLQNEDLTDAIRIVRSALHGFISLEIGEGFKQVRSLDATFTRLVSTLDAALTANGVPDRRAR